ncbi:MAG: stage II sporulation protein D [Bacilli bacterium]|nr:stage II sporulation protein D [Bacilli bacterium]
MKKMLISILIVIFVPYIIVTVFIKNNEIKIDFVSNMNVRVKRETKNKIDIVPLEDYVIGVLSGEMPLSFEKEALKAQAVAARSYVLKKIEQNYNKEYDVVDTIANQVYLDNEDLKIKFKDEYEEKIVIITEVVKKTSGEYLTYNKEVIEAFFFSTSSGMTENCEEVFQESLPYLKSVDSHYDEISPSYLETKQIKLSEFYQLLNLKYDEQLLVEIIKTTSTGRIKEIKINDQIFTANEIRSKLKLKSTFFSIEQVNDDVIIKTKGYGHGVGMSQYGANGMAKEGYKYDEILKHYYSGVEIEKI